MEPMTPAEAYRIQNVLREATRQIMAASQSVDQVFLAPPDRHVHAAPVPESLCFIAEARVELGNAWDLLQKHIPPK